MYFYKKENGSYYLLNREILNQLDQSPEIILMADEVAVLFDSRMGVLLKHGDKENVSAYMKRCKKQGLDIRDFQIVSSSRWKCDELNKILEISDYVQRLLDPDKSKLFFE
jgi:hypothetical protein